MKVILKENYFINARGYRVFYRIWENSDKKCKRFATIVHGLGDHSGRYSDLASFLMRHDCMVSGIDLCGFGKSEGKRGDVKSLYDFIEDEKNFFGMFSRKDERLIVGQSLGGLIALDYLEEYPEDFTHAIIASPAINPARNVPPYLLAVSKILRFVIPASTFKNRIRTAQLSDDKNIQDSYKSDEYVHNRITPRFFQQFLKMSERVKRNCDKLNKDLKILFIHGDADEILFHGDTQAFVNTLSVENKSLFILPHMKHETLNDVQKKKTYKIISDWLDANLV